MSLLTEWNTYTDGLNDGEIGIEGFRISSQASRDGAFTRTGAINSIAGREIRAKYDYAVLGKPARRETSEKPVLLGSMKLGETSSLSSNPAVRDFTNTLATLRRRFALASTDVEADDLNFDGIAENWVTTKEYSGPRGQRDLLYAEVYSAKSGEPAVSRKNLGEILGRSGFQVITWSPGHDPKDHMTPGYSLAAVKMEQLRDEGILRFWEIGTSLGSRARLSRDESNTGSIELSRKNLLTSLPDYTPIVQRDHVSAELGQVRTFIHR